MHNNIIAHISTVDASIDPMAPQTAILDQDTMGSLHILEAAAPGMIEILIASYFEDAPKAIMEIHDAIRAANCKAVASAAHRLKGSSSIFGATRLAHLCAELEKLGRANELGEAVWRLKRIESVYADVSRALIEERQRLAEGVAISALACA